MRKQSTRSSSAGPAWAATWSTVVAVFCGTGLEGGPLTPSLIVDCASGPAAAFFLCLLPVRPMPLVPRGIGTCHRAVFGAEQARMGHDHRSTMWPCLGHITCVVVCRHTRQEVPPARLPKSFHRIRRQFFAGSLRGAITPPTSAESDRECSVLPLRHVLAASQGEFFKIS